MTCDTSFLNHLIKSQQKKVCKEMQTIVKQKATHSAYPALSRADRRRAEYHSDRVSEEKALQKDVQKAGRMAARIAQVLEKVRKELNKIKNHLGSFNFASTVGADANADGDCSADLSAGIETRQQYRDQLQNMMTMLANYVEAQYLGDYAILHDLNGACCAEASDSSNCADTPSTSSCCPLIYRSKFHYFTPVGDCLTMPNQGCDEHSGSTATTSNDDKTDPASNNHNVVTNHDLKLRCMERRLRGDYYAWWLVLGPRIIQPETHGTAVNTDTADFSFNHPSTAIDGTTGTAADTTAAKVALHSILQNLEGEVHLPKHFTDSDCQSTNTALNELSVALHGGLIDSADGHAHEKFKAVVDEFALISNIEDETDLVPIITEVVAMMNRVRECQLKNDGERENLNFVQETSECNQAFHEESFGELTCIDETELCTRYETGKQIAAELDTLRRDVCCGKKRFFFTKITWDGSCEW
jgi:hypothetical protein